MKDEFLDLVQHTYDLGFIDTVKITGLDTETKINSIAEDRSVVLDAHFANALPDLKGTFGMPNLAKLKILLNLPEYKENAKISVTHKTKNDEVIPSGIHFENATGDFQNEYRFMTQELITEKLKTPVFKGANWNVEFEPSIESLKRLKMQAQANSEEPNCQISTEGGNLKFMFGDKSNHSGEFVFHAGVTGSLRSSKTYRVKQIISILDLVGDKLMRISDSGVLQIIVHSGIAEYHYYLLAYSS